MPRLLLINPAHGVSFWGFDYAMDLLKGAYSNAPLALLTVAGLTPDDWRIEIADENVGPVDLDTPCDVVGITAMNTQAHRAFALADEFRRRGRLVVIGGPFATLEPHRCEPHADVVVAGEAERTWPAFCRDYERGEQRRRYVETGTIDLSESPTPRYDLISADSYASLPIQTTRGCPFNCEFCDIIVMQGRRVRTKPYEQVLAEIEAIRRTGGRSIFFTDDNYIGNIKYVRGLLDRLIEHRRDTGYEPLLFTQTSVNLAEHEDLLERMTRAGFTRLFIGIETPRQTSLRETGKRQNLHGDLVDRVRTIQRAGIMIWAGMIVGFDHDDKNIFEEQADFLDEAGIPVAMVGMLNAPPKTPLFTRLTAEGRIAQNADWADNCAWTNIVPKQMTRAELFGGYADLVQELYEQQNYARRVHKNIEAMGAPARNATSARLPSRSDLRDLWRAISTFTFSRDPVRRRHFVPNFLRLVRDNPSRIVEGCIHLGLWRHFETYVPELVGKLREAQMAERLHDREAHLGQGGLPALRVAAQSAS
jgi:radical SAM superfamily enzyme YgiQ (UPF0313 family)